MATPLEQAAEAIHRTHHNDEGVTCVGYWPEDMTVATAAIEALRESANQRLVELRDGHRRCGGECGVSRLWEEDRYDILNAIFGVPEEGE